MIDLKIMQLNPISERTDKHPDKVVFDTAVLYERGNRLNMEDRYILLQQKPHNLYCGVYDGHGGSLAAEYACEHLHEKFMDHLDQGINEAFLEAYRQIDDEITAANMGTTALDFFLDHNILHYAHAGDSRLIVIKGQKAWQLTFDHRVFDPDEAKRVRALDAAIDDGYVVKGEFALQPTRTLGDQYFKKAGVIAEPSIGTYHLATDDNWLVAATDGLFDYLDNGKVAEIVSSCATADEACEKLKQDALADSTRDDNITAIVVKLK